MIMQSVNQLLQISGQDVFSALDIAVFNQASGEMDFIKVGASDGFIKREDSVEVVEAGSLPIGILEDPKSPAQFSPQATASSCAVTA
jgi:stage II sporulation protein E